MVISMLNLKYMFGLVLCAVFLFACAPATNSGLKGDPQIYWIASPQAFESVVLSFVQSFDTKFANAVVIPDPLPAQFNNTDTIILNQNVFTDTDDKPYRLTMFVEWSASEDYAGVFTLTNEESPNSLLFTPGTLAFRLNAELTKVLDGKFRRTTN